MKILYSLLGVGNGHIARAREVIPALQKFADVTVAISGSHSEVALPVRPSYTFHGLGFKFGTTGGIAYLDTFKELQVPQLFRDVKRFREEELYKYDLLINDCEPVTSNAAKKSIVPTLLWSHQAAFLSNKTPRPRTNAIFDLFMDSYAPSSQALGIHFQAYDSFIRTPVIRREVRNLQPVDNGYFTVYLPAYGDDVIIKLLQKIPGISWQVFSKHSKYIRHQANVYLEPINNERFLKSLESCGGLVCGAGFEAPSEALYLGKKLIAIPQRGQYEQLCNAEALRRLGVAIFPEFSSKTIQKISDAAQHAKNIQINFPDETEKVAEAIVSFYETKKSSASTKVISFLDRKIVRKSILARIKQKNLAKAA